MPSSDGVAARRRPSPKASGPGKDKRSSASEKSGYHPAARPEIGVVVPAAAPTLTPAAARVLARLLEHARLRDENPSEPDERPDKLEETP